MDFSQVSISTVQQYWNNRPCNIRHSTAEVGTKQYYDEVEARKYRVEPHIPGFADFQKYQDKNVLELGCGLGTESINFVRAGAILTIVELSDTSLELCKKRFEVYGLQDKVTFIHGNGEDLDKLLFNKQFDLIWSFGVIHHSPHPEVIMDHFYNLLVPGGELKLMVYSKVSYKLFYLMKETNCWDFSDLDKIISTYSEAQVGCPVTYTYTIEEAKILCNKFVVSDIHKDHIFCWDIEKYKQYQYEKEDCWKNVPEEQFHQLEKELGWHTLITASKPKYMIAEYV